MPITVTCPNGHQLTAKESNAGKTGKCPVCQAPITIPALNEDEISESAILNILGTPEPQNHSRIGTVIAPPKRPIVRRATKSASASSAKLPHIKLCPSCEREIDMGYHICPHCHTYITGLNDF